MAAASYDPSKIWTTLLTNRSGYLAGLLVLDHSIKKQLSKYQLVVMISGPVQDDVPFMNTLEAAGIPVKIVKQLEPTPRNGKRIKGTWEKLAPWSFTEYKRIVLLDSDQVALQNFDEMMTMDIGENNIAASHACTCNPRKLAHYPKDWIPENCAFTAANKLTGEPEPITSSSPKNHHLLNSGTVILEPSLSQYSSIIETMNTHPSVPDMIFYDQDLLPIVYPDWKPLPYIYNGLKTLRGCHADLWKDGNVKILHYILQKPWTSRIVDEGDIVTSTHKHWWDAYEELENKWIASGNATKVALWKEVVEPHVAAKTKISTAQATQAAWYKASLEDVKARAGLAGLTGNDEIILPISQIFLFLGLALSVIALLALRASRRDPVPKTAAGKAKKRQ